MARKIEDLLRVVADLKTLEQAPQSNVIAFGSGELGEEDLDLVSAAAQTIPAQLKDILRPEGKK